MPAAALRLQPGKRHLRAGGADIDAKAEEAGEGRRLILGEIMIVVMVEKARSMIVPFQLAPKMILDPVPVLRRSRDHRSPRR
ncbi:MAG TPA: hypothetical protein VNQ78_20300 [Paracoccus sp. (in: a-proteobacteria)]|uniref:hypothetical protein n=1 Tax=Paracoccus sp. TaxID=267 RepID=UPI002C1BD751|nr:hypothetical protein [Paracoccus sp. (in: a-proteobacteria)]HWL58999.1 hypothetical protein [Paracoccus sp. (in: a-proteobacteria)]